MESDWGLGLSGSFRLVHLPAEDFDVFSPRVDARHFPPRTKACVGSSCGGQRSSGGGEGSGWKCYDWTESQV